MLIYIYFFKYVGAYSTSSGEMIHYYYSIGILAIHTITIYTTYAQRPQVARSPCGEMRTRGLSAHCVPPTAHYRP